MTKFRNMRADSMTNVGNGVFKYTVFLRKHYTVPSIGDNIILDGIKREIIDIKENAPDFNGDKFVDIFVYQFRPRRD